MIQKELNKILKEHKKWLNDHTTGERADLRGADLEEADLKEADLRRADLRRADLKEADLKEADLRGADLRGADLEGVKGVSTFIRCPQEGSFIGYKKVKNGLGIHVILTLEIRSFYKRVNCIGSMKCRANKVFVVKAETIDGTKLHSRSGYSSFIDSRFKYVVGKVVKAEKYNDSDRIECSDGIHFFMAKQEAIEY